MKELFACMKCKTTWGRELGEAHTCPNCISELTPTGIDLEQWKSFSDEVKSQKKKELFQVTETGTDNILSAIESNLKSLTKDIRTIKNILLFFTILWAVLILFNLMVIK